MLPNSNPRRSTPADDSHSHRDRPGPGRPRTLNDAKRREICALVAGGCGLQEAAKYVRCGVNTVRREADRNPEFHENLRRAEMYAQLSPLRAMQHACSTHWRAAAWMLERAFPDRFARPEAGAFGARQARQLLGEVLNVISSETSDPFKFERIEKRVRGTFEYYIRSACDRRRSARSLRNAMKFFEQKDRNSDPLAARGITIPDFSSFIPPTPAPRDSTPVRRQSPSDVRRGSPLDVGRGSPDPAPPTTEGLQNPRSNSQ
jgi:hypothetical protein